MMEHHQDELPLRHAQPKETRVALGERVDCSECGAIDVPISLDWTMRKHRSWEWTDGPVKDTSCTGPDADQVFLYLLSQHNLTRRLWRLQQEGLLPEQQLGRVVE